MNRRSFFRILLSLVLLLSQQMAIAHAMGHVANLRLAATAVQAGVNLADDVELSKAIAQDQSCSQCLAFDQLGGPLGQPPSLYLPGEIASSPIFLPATAAACKRTVCVFASRAPPSTK